MPVPTYDKLFNPTLAALRELGGSGTNEELAETVGSRLGLSEQDLAELTRDGTRSRFEYRLAWARSYLKAFGLISNSERGVWSLTDKGRSVEVVDPVVVKRHAKSKANRPSGEHESSAAASEIEPAGSSPVEAEQDAWEADLGRILLELQPDQFERLCQRLLRESGFSQVIVTGRTGDGGIDGTGVVRLGGFLSFPILFQCKRYRGSIGPSVVRDFRGAMVGRADRGLILTTGVFTRDAKLEASRDGAPPIDLVDGELLIEKLRERRLGLSVEMVERITVDKDWFTGL